MVSLCVMCVNSTNGDDDDDNDDYAFFLTSLFVPIGSLSLSLSFHACLLFCVFY